MPKTRAVVAAVAISAVSFTPAAFTAPPSHGPCTIAQDPTGDSQYTYLASLGAAPALDVVGVDIATTAQHVTARLRLVTTAVDSGDRLAESGLRWVVQFDVGGVTYAFNREREAGGVYSDYFTVNGNPEPAPGLTVVQGPTSITWTASRAAVHKLTKPRQVLELVTGQTYWLFGPSRADNSDVGPETFYVDKSVNCRVLCPLVPDHANDAFWTPSVMNVNRATPLDITGLDIATGPKTVTVVLGVDTAIAPTANVETWTQHRMRWSATFTAGGTTYTVRRTRAGVGPGGTQGTYTNELLAGGTVVAVPAVTVAKDSITWTVPRSAVSGLKPGQVISGLRADATWTEADRPMDSVVAPAATTYTDRAPSCVRAS